MDSTRKILVFISETTNIKLDILISKVKNINENFIEIVKVFEGLNFYSFTIRTESRKLLKINFNVQYANGIKTKNYRRTYNWKIFYIEN